MFEANELSEALKVIESVDGYSDDNLFSSMNKSTLTLFDDIPKNVSFLKSQWNEGWNLIWNISLAILCIISVIKR